MNHRIWPMVTVAVCVTLLAGCGGATSVATPTATTMPAATATPTPTAMPTVVPAPEGPQAVVVDVINAVDAHALPGEDWAPARVDMTIYQKGEVWAKEESTARVGIEQDLVRVAPNTIFTFEQPDADTLQLTLDEGQVWVNVEGLAAGQTFEVETPAAVASVRGTRFSVRALPGGATVVSSRVDTVTVSTAAGAVDVGAWRQTTVAPGDVPSAPAPMAPEEEIRWGMAAGPGLDVALPVFGDAGTFGYTGQTFSYDWSPAGDYFALSYYDPQTGAFTNVFYDANAETAIPSPLPFTVFGLFFDPVDEGRFAFQSVDGPNQYLCQGDMQGPLQGTCFGGNALYGWPLWSPDGNWLLFYSNSMLGDKGYNLFTSGPGGVDLMQVTFNEAGYAIRQAWSPDSQRFAYVSTDEYNGPGDVWVAERDGSGARLLFQGAYGNGFDHLDWNPDGSSLAVPGDGGGLYVVPLDGSDSWAVNGTEERQCWEPAWSPTSDGWPLFFYSYAADGEREMLWYAPAPGAEPIGLGYADWGPVWTQDGGRAAIAYTDEGAGAPQTTVYLVQTEPAFWP